MDSASSSPTRYPTHSNMRSALLPSREMSDAMQKKAEPQAMNESDASPRGRTPRFSLASGDRPLDGFTIKRGVGTGGFGEVYYATSDAGKEVALKRIQRNLDIELRGVRQCLNLKHPNLVALFDIKYDADDQAWVVMEFVAGKTLAEVIERNPNGMPLDEVNRWFDGITAGVAHLHESGIVHRDLKPGNIFSDQTTVKIGDYGLSKFISCSRRSGHTQSVGTFHYMAPEVGQGRYGKEIDIYALGIMLYEMLTGQVPYDGESSHEIIMKHLTATPVLTGIAQPYRTVIATSLAKDPTARKLSVAQMRAMIADRDPSIVEGFVARQQKRPNGSHELAALAPNFQGSPVETAHNIFSFANEPVAQGISAAWRDIARGWQQTRFGTFTKFAILLLAIPLVLANSRMLVPMALITLLTYGLYFLIRGLILYNVPIDDTATVLADYATENAGAADRQTEAWDGNVNTNTSTQSPVAASNGPVLAELVPMNRRQRRHVQLRRKAIERSDKDRNVRQIRASLGQKTVWKHGVDLVASWILATLVCGMAGLIFLISTELSATGSAMEWLPTCLWAIMTSAIAASGLLFVAKSWESSTGEGTLRRFLQLLLGIGVGAAAWGLQQFMQLTPEYVLDENVEGVFRESAPNLLYDAAGYPTLAAFMAFFGTLFLLVRWWRQTDPIRSTRLSLWRTLLSGLAGFCVYVFLPFPGGILIALTTSVAVQIAAAYMDHEERRLVCDEAIL